MNIPFWSNERRSGTTANLAAVSIMCALRSAYRVTLLENHYSEHSLGKMLLSYPKSHLVKEEVIYYLGHGISDCLVPRVLRNGCGTGGPFLEILEERLFYMLQLQAAGNLFELEFTGTILPMLRSKKQEEELWMIDTECNHNISSKLLLNEADLAVVILRKDLSCVLDFLKNDSELKDKSILLFTNFEHSKEEDAVNHLLKEEFDQERFVQIPYCSEFKAAVTQGRCVEFIASHAEDSPEEPCFPWIQAVDRAARLILNICGKERDENGKKDEILPDDGEL